MSLPEPEKLSGETYFSGVCRGQLWIAATPTIDLPVPTIASISHSGDSNFAVWSYGNSSDLLINEIGTYSGQVRWPGGPALVEISADGDWTIELE